MEENAFRLFESTVLVRYLSCWCGNFRFCHLNRECCIRDAVLPITLDVFLRVFRVVQSSVKREPRTVHAARPCCNSRHGSGNIMKLNLLTKGEASALTDTCKRRFE